MLSNTIPFSENITLYNNDKEIISFLKNNPYLNEFYSKYVDEPINYILPLVLPFSDTSKPYEYTMILIVKYEHKTDLGQWEIFMLDNFLIEETNISQLLNYLEQGTNISLQELMKIFHQAVKEKLIEDNLPSKVSLKTQPSNKYIAFCIPQNMDATPNPFIIENEEGEVILKSYKGNDTHVVIPDNVTIIGYDAFKECSKLQNITIPNSVKKIEDNTFNDSKNIETINIDMTTIRKGFLYANIKYIVLGKNVMNIHKDAFFNYENYDKLIDIKVHPENQYYVSDNGILFNKEKTILLKYPAGKMDISYEIPNSVNIIADNAFFACTKLTNITIPNSVTSICYMAFDSCSSLTSIVIPDSVTSIENMAFYSCRKLKHITIGKGVNKITHDMFFSCVELNDINIPNGVKTIEGAAFGSCSNLTNIIIPNGVETIGGTAFWNCFSLKNITIPSSVVDISKSAFSGCCELVIRFESTTPPKFGSMVFKDVENIEVPIESLEIYKDKWHRYATKIIGY